MTTLDPSSTFSQQQATPCTAWMPLDGVAHQWASFAGTFLSYHAFTATSAVFSALASEAGAVRQYNEACQSRARGQTEFARDSYEQAACDLHKASSQWMHALYCLRRLASDHRSPLDEEEHAALPRFLTEATTQLQRVGMLTQQVQAEYVRCYQQPVLLGYGETEEMSR